MICLPWTIRNAVQFHRLIPLRSNFPFELWMGNNEIYDLHSHEVTRITRYEQIHLYQKLGETAFLADKFQKAKAFIHGHPALTLHLAGQRFIATWLGTATPYTDFLRADSSLARFILFWNAVTVILALRWSCTTVHRPKSISFSSRNCSARFPLGLLLYANLPSTSAPLRSSSRLIVGDRHFLSFPPLYRAAQKALRLNCPNLDCGLGVKSFFA